VLTISSEKEVTIFQATLPYIKEDSNRQCHGRKNISI